MASRIVSALETALRRVSYGVLEEGYQPVRLHTDRGEVLGRFYGSLGATRGVVWVGGIGGGWDTPARGLYPRLARALADEGIASLRVRFRHRTDFEESVHDVLAGLQFLRERGAEALGIVGHSFGGAVAIHAGALTPRARAVVALATQSAGTALVHELAGRCGLMLVHGTADGILPPRCSEQVYELAEEPKHLVLFEGAGHVLDEVADPLATMTAAWLRDHLGNGRA